MKIIAIFILLFFTASTNAQETDSSYFPKEQLLNRKCSKSENPEKCLQDFFTTRIAEVLMQKQNIKLLNKYKKDTLYTTVEFSVNNFGDIVDSTSFVVISRFKKSDELTVNLKRNILELPRFLVKNRKKQKYTSFHTFENKFILTKRKSAILLQAIDTESPYEGGAVKEAPRFPGCQNINQELYHRQCFQEMIQKHIRKNFKYPQNALRDRIKGVVYIDLIIDKNGRTKKMKAKGPHPLLEEEAKRIMSVLPQLIPGKYDGIVSEYPYSIPITFAIR